MTEARTANHLRSEYMSSIEQTIDRYVASWNETDAAKRRALVDQSWTSDGVYVDPVLKGESPAEIADAIGAVQGQFPGLRMRLAGPIDVHHERARFNWAFVPAGGEQPVVAGIDFATFSTDGKLQSITGFIDLMPG
jgi:hypothetical protein